MGVSSLIKAVTASLVFSATVLAGDVTNSSQHVVANTLADESIDLSKVQKFKSLFNEHQQRPLVVGDAAEARKWEEVFDGAFKWKDILEGSGPLSAVCSDRCRSCASGCNPICCLVSGTHVSGSRPGQPSGDGAADPVESAAATAPGTGQSLRTPGIFRPRPIPPLACPCHCEASCPRNVQAICCFTPGSAKDPPVENRDRHVEPASDSPQKPIALPHEWKWGRPNRPAACPCHCEASCPAYIQAICCTTPGTGAASRAAAGSAAGGDADGAGDEPPPASSPPHDILALVTETASGEPVSVEAGVNITIFDSFITMDLVNGLERSTEIASNDDLKIFEIILDVVVGPKDKEQTLRQSFQVIDGTKLWEKEQIMLGLGFMARINSLAVKDEFLTNLEQGLPVIAGTRP